MNWDDPEYLQAIRLVRKFFPESQAVASFETGLDWADFVLAMTWADCQRDSSCDPFSDSTVPEMTLASKGGTEGLEAEVYTRLLAHTGFSPTGRVVVIPQTLERGGWSLEDRLPFICHSQTLLERLREFDSMDIDRVVFNGNSDTLLVYESGQALLVNHDDCFFWAKSKIRQWNKAPK